MLTKQGIGRLKDKKGALEGKNAEDCGMSSKREDLRHRKICGTSPEKGCCGTEVHCQRGGKQRW